MKRKLVILRHAKAESFGIVASDYDRTLVPQGVLAAKATAAKLRKAGIKPGWMGASSAPRALYTLRIAVMELGISPEQVQAFDELYSGTSSEILNLVRRIPDDVSEAIICGHNPAVSEAAAELCGFQSGTPCLATAEAVILELDSESWAEAGLSINCSMIQHIVTQDRR